MMRIDFPLRVGFTMLIAGIFLSFMLVLEEVQEGTIINQPVFAQIGVPTGTIQLNESNMTTEIAPNISEDTTITPAPDVNDTLIGRSTPTSSNTLQTDEVNNKTGEAEPIGGVK
jgi:hypothetical protein